MQQLILNVSHLWLVYRWSHVVVRLLHKPKGNSHVIRHLWKISTKKKSWSILHVTSAKALFVIVLFRSNLTVVISRVILNIARWFVLCLSIMLSGWANGLTVIKNEKLVTRFLCTMWCQTFLIIGEQANYSCKKNFSKLNVQHHSYRPCKY